MRTLNAWHVSPREAAAIQERLAPLVVQVGGPDEVRHVAGVDVAFAGGRTVAAVAVLRYPELDVAEVARAELPTDFPYVPGLLSFREAPAILDAWAKLRTEPDLIVVDGHGVAHPRRLGIAAHLGLWLDKPTIGSAKSPLVGRPGFLADDVGATADIVDRDEVVGLAVRTKAGAKPIYVSVGHHIALESAARWTLCLCRGYRLPEPQRQAHLAASARSAR